MTGALAPSDGFSLVELMIALALSVFLVGALILTYTSGTAAARDAAAMSRIQENMRFLSDHLLRDIRNAGFRDQLTLTLAEYLAIGGNYARVENDGAELRVRYAARQHCGQARQQIDSSNVTTELKVVENRYFVEQLNNDDPTNVLKCEGAEIGLNVGSDGSFTETRTAERTVTLVGGIEKISFELLRTNGSGNSCNYDTDLDDACTGVSIELTFAGLDAADEREVQMKAAFRNVLVDRMFGRES